jgi:hypothetical protein
VEYSSQFRQIHQRITADDIGLPTQNPNLICITVLSGAVVSGGAVVYAVAVVSAGSVVFDAD